jgi:hypothetical protein
MKRENRKSKVEKAEPRKKAALKSQPANGSDSQGTAGTIRRWVETLDRISRAQPTLRIAGALSH